MFETCGGIVAAATVLITVMVTTTITSVVLVLVKVLTTYEAAIIWSGTEFLELSTHDTHILAQK